MKNKFFDMNARGDVPITILVVGVFAICSLALFSFYLSGTSGDKIFLKVSIVEKTNSLADEIRFYKNPEINGDPEKIMEIFKNKNSEENLVYSAKHGNGLYEINATYFENEQKWFGFDFGERKPMFSVLYRFAQ
ncbi:MAG: hypothetical protein UY01_C0006G0002 [Candidatus Nomurabacteria bacterium GW2011_GWB1_47_6]|uniref:Uncharacterized protein n=1 Tax=Candidatus Nomurabacteria bacterium GW2011_GWB1_47_6 TaxID=1618749 RepID=A0A0G1VC13_9BACT|nr:MAG: hypothetical protein UY01_C0006G0002 [Candidatus Nomurabacteria bacterium GW2011_GWB1_47_6]